MFSGEVEEGGEGEGEARKGNIGVERRTTKINGTSFSFFKNNNKKQRNASQTMAANINHHNIFFLILRT